MINNGRIIFQEEKDFLLDTYRIVKGDVKALTDDVRKHFLSITETALDLQMLPNKYQRYNLFSRTLLLNVPQ